LRSVYRGQGRTENDRADLDNHQQGRLLKQSENFEDDHNNNNHSNYVKDVSIHVRH